MRERMATETAVSLLRRRLRQKRIAPQERIEPERVLAQVLGCSRQTLRGAFDQLEQEGLIWRHVGQGTFMGPRPQNVAITPRMLFESASPTELMTARLVVEPALASAAAASATSRNVALLRELAFRTCEARSSQDYEVADEAFHKSIAAITGNRLLAAIFDMLSSVRGRARWQRRHDAIFRWAREREYSLAQGAIHLAIVDAIEAGDVERASNAMNAHLVAIQNLVIRGDASGAGIFGSD